MEETNEPKLSITGLRNVLWEEIKKVRAGETSPANVNAITNATGKILSTVKLQMEFAKITGQVPNIEMLQIAEK